ncbi:MAG: Holliday junction branch migration protein RuvA [Alphaproteobacteria bacterium]|nr:Holliday junction branch migration protein RuvA [Alphaproteobacteria bacterium]
MIGRLKGIVAEIGEGWIILDVGGVGYLVHVSARTLGALAEGGVAALQIETYLREDSLKLYGFLSRAERDWFRALQTVQGVGAKVSLAVLSIAPPDALAEAVLLGDDKLFARAAGVGPKLAKRLSAELKDKVPGGPLAPQSGPALAVAGGTSRATGPEADALSALVNLGYGEAEAARALKAARARAGEAADAERLIVEGLRELAR